jgi:hypothetical protein
MLAKGLPAAAMGALVAFLLASPAGAQTSSPAAAQALPPAGVAVDPPAAMPPPEPKRSMVPAGVLGGLAAGGLYAGIVFSSMLSGANAEADTAHLALVARHEKNCIPNARGYDSLWCSQLVAAGNAADAFYYAAIGTFIVGGAAAAGTALYLLWPSLRPKTAEPRAVRDVRLTPIPGRNGGWLLLSGSF